MAVGDLRLNRNHAHFLGRSSIRCLLKAAGTAVVRISSAPNQMQIDHKIVNPATGNLDANSGRRQQSAGTAAYLHRPSRDRPRLGDRRICKVRANIAKPDASGRRLLSWLGGSYPPLPHQQASEDRGMLPTIRALPQLPLTIHHRLHYPAFGRLVGFGMGPITVDTLPAEARRYGCVLDASLGLIRGRASRNIVLKSP
jgi:hypothetical protein